MDNERKNIDSEPKAKYRIMMGKELFEDAVAEYNDDALKPESIWEGDDLGEAKKQLEDNHEKNKINRNSDYKEFAYLEEFDQAKREYGQIKEKPESEKKRN